jgi:hypothetical protein
MAELDLLKVLADELRGRLRHLKRLDNYYEGEQPVQFVTHLFEDEVGEPIAHLVLNWPQLVADAFQERLDIEGFRYPNTATGDDHLWDLWQSNDGDEQSQQANLDAIIFGETFVIVGPSDDLPVFTVESPMQVGAYRDPRTRKLTRAVKLWDERDTDGQKVEWANLYLANGDADGTATRITYRKGQSPQPGPRRP